MALERLLAQAMLHLLRHPEEAVRRAAEEAFGRAQYEAVKGVPWSREHIQQVIVRTVLWAGLNVQHGGDLDYWADNTRTFIERMAADELAAEAVATRHLQASALGNDTLTNAIRVCARRPGAPKSGQAKGGRSAALVAMLKELGIHASTESAAKLIERTEFSAEDLADLKSLYQSSDKPDG